MAGKCKAGKLKLLKGYRFRFYWRATVSLLALQGGKMFHNKGKNKRMDSV